MVPPIRTALLVGIAEWQVWTNWHEEIEHLETNSLFEWLEEPVSHLSDI